jgi:hypothetical protein
VHLCDVGGRSEEAPMLYPPPVRLFRPCLFSLLLAVLAAGCRAESAPGEAIVPGLISGTTSALIAMQSDWTGGYCADVTVGNSGTAPTTTWMVVVNLNQSRLTNLWGANQTTSGSSMTTTPLSYDAVVAPGSSVTFGFCANAAGSNYHPRITSVRPSVPAAGPMPRAAAPERGGPLPPSG